MKRILLISYCLLMAKLAFGFQVSGVVTDAKDKSPLTGVAVVVQDLPGVGTTTDLDGNYSLEVPEGKSLVFSYLGYLPTTKAVTRSGIINVELSEDTHELTEFVFIGYVIRYMFLL